MNSPARMMHSKYQRHFGWNAALATILVVGLVGVELIFPGELRESHGLRRLLVAVAAVVALVSLAGLIVVTLLTRLARNKDQEDAIEERQPDHGLTEEPANERLRALRAVVSSLEEAPGRKA